MFFKSIILLFFILNSLIYASYEKVRVGIIDKHYSNKISRNHLKNIIYEIEQTFEAQLGMNIFDYDESGKNIDILFVEASTIEKRINRKIKKLDDKKIKIDKFEKDLPNKLKELEQINKDYDSINYVYNKKVKRYNDYVKNANSKKITSKDEYNKIKSYIDAEKRVLNSELKRLNKKQKEVQKIVNTYNKSIIKLNNTIRSYNLLANDIERLSRSFTKVKGRAIGQKEITIKSFYKGGEKIQEKTVTNSMNKIEIYGFDSIAELKAVLAHEIAHLVGIPHIEIKNALMNPILQKNQIENLQLTSEDIYNFNKHF